MNEFNVVYQQLIVLYDSGCQNYSNWSRLNVTDKHDNLPSHFKLALGQPALL